ncbi:hypothetical protein VM1G_09609 [Cytospora mali]|uniref:Uncharacterized protein n=1 Tax=Cytospora mali TaxID=578113 RepID=A0A194WBX8_CYTMA|nr:hypothetical protein VM1G_09609 [Valsa mali]
MPADPNLPKGGSNATIHDQRQSGVTTILEDFVRIPAGCNPSRRGREFQYHTHYSSGKPRRLSIGPGYMLAASGEGRPAAGGGL